MTELAVVNEHHIVASRIDLSCNLPLQRAQAEQVQATDALVEPAEGPPRQGRGAERVDHIGAAVRAQVTENMVGRGEGIDLDFMVFGKTPGHLIERPLAAA